ncbi:MAG: type VI secretion system baseplate subunit TssG [Pseudomonadota bacterium]
MGTDERDTTGNLTLSLLPQAHRHQFFQLVERLHQVHGDNLEQMLDIRPEDERLRFRTDPALGFPRAEVTLAQPDTTEEIQRYQLQVAFLGMHGGASPLPHHYLERIAYESHQGIGIRAAFFDFFNHRLMTLLHRGWRKYRYYVRFQQDATDRFSQTVFSLIGLNDRSLRGETPIPWSRLLTYSGMIATRSRAPSMVGGIIAHSFDLPQVQIQEWQPYHTLVPADQQIRLGQRNGNLGQSFTLGERVHSIGGKFSIVIRGLSQARFRQFLPDGEHFAPLQALISFLLRDQLAYDLRLGIVQQDIPPLQLNTGTKQGVQLGWTSFLGRAGLKKETDVRISVRT